MSTQQPSDAVKEITPTSSTSPKHEQSDLSKKDELKPQNELKPHEIFGAHPSKPRTGPTKGVSSPKIVPPKEPILPQKLQLRFTAYSWAKLCFAVTSRDTEVGALALSSAHDPLLIEDVTFVKQYASAAFVRLDDDAVADWMSVVGDPRGAYRAHPTRFNRIFVHTHPKGCNFPSGHDEGTFSSKFGHYPWAVMFILTKDLKTYCRIRLNHPSGATVQVEIPVIVDWTIPFPGTDHKSWGMELTNILPSQADPYNQAVVKKLEITVTPKPKEAADDPKWSTRFTGVYRDPESVKSSTADVDVYLKRHSVLSFIPARYLKQFRERQLPFKNFEVSADRDLLKALSRVGIDLVAGEPDSLALFTVPKYGFSRMPIGTNIIKCVHPALFDSLPYFYSSQMPKYAEDYYKAERLFIMKLRASSIIVTRKCIVTDKYVRCADSWTTMDFKEIFLSIEEFHCINQAKRYGVYDEILQLSGESGASLNAINTVTDWSQSTTEAGQDESAVDQIDTDKIYPSVLDNTDTIHIVDKDLERITEYLLLSSACVGHELITTEMYGLFSDYVFDVSCSTLEDINKGKMHTLDLLEHLQELDPLDVMAILSFENDKFRKSILAALENIHTLLTFADKVAKVTRDYEGVSSKSKR